MMPVIKLKHVCSVSSEDPNHPADNLLTEETYRKWACAAGGEKQAVVVIDFEKASNIHSIDIGNNGSAFIEVLVGRSSGGSEEYQVLLVASSFMSPSECKGWTNANRVRMFGKDKLSKGIVDQKWDRVKIVCTQPFNKTEKYGLSFIKFHSPPTEGTTPTDDQESSSKKIGIFNLKSEPKSLPSGSTLLFKKEAKDATPPKTMAAKVRQATSEALKGEDATVTSEPAKLVKPDSKKTESTRKKPASSIPKEAPPTKKTKAEKPPNVKLVEPVLFDELLKGVVFSLSGFQNPYRGELRGKAIEMGAKYEPDWGPHCTHLICAFANTPKFSQVKSHKGIIVKKEWILDCYKTKKRQLAKKYRFPSSNDDDSEDEKDYYDKREYEIYKKVQYTQKESKKQEDKTDITLPSHLLPQEEDDPYGGSTDECSDMETKPVTKERDGSHRHDDTDEYDTEDEIEMVRKKQICGISSADTDKTDSSKKDEMKVSDTQRSLLDLPDLFSNFYFFLYGDFSAADRRLLTRYITAYNGCLESYMTDKVTHVITQEQWDDNFEQALAENNSLVFLEPSWVFTCHSQRSKIPCEEFAITPS